MLDKKIGILGGGQLGRMLLEAASPLDLAISVMDKKNDFPAANLCADFVEGDFTDYDDVVEFGRDKDIITVEIEKVNLEALRLLEREGKDVYPQPRVLAIIQDKGLQKDFYQDNGFPTSSYIKCQDNNEVLSLLEREVISFPFVQKSRKDGYDGRGVSVIKSADDINKLIDTPCIVEDLVEIDKEISVVVGRNPSGDVRSFPVVDMIFDPEANLVSMLHCPSLVGPTVQDQAVLMAEKLAEKFKIVGLLAVEMFLSTDGQLLINEVAPRPHNSGHHTIEACITSQFEQHLRSILGLPLGDTSLIKPAVMINLLGEKGYSGPVKYDGIKEVLRERGVHVHLYGKKETKPSRKMGHVTMMADDLDSAIEMANFVKNKLKVIS